MFRSFEERRIECKLVFFPSTVLEVLSTCRFRSFLRRGLRYPPISTTDKEERRCEMWTAADMHRQDISQPKTCSMPDDAFPMSIKGWFDV